jgi:predicted RNA binding protein YcfA (HicA-like mRNA interferase family)
MTKLPRDVSGLECLKALEKIGFLFHHQRGSHAYLVRDDPPSTISVPMHNTLKPGTLRAIIRQAGLTVTEFVSLL